MTVMDFRTWDIVGPDIRPQEPNASVCMSADVVGMLGELERRLFMFPSLTSE